MKSRKFSVIKLVKRAFHKLTSVKRIGSAVINTAKKPRKLLRAMLFRLKELKSKGKYKALRMQIKKGKSGSFLCLKSKRPARYHSSAAYIMMEEAYFPLM